MSRLTMHTSVQFSNSHHQTTRCHHIPQEIFAGTDRFVRNVCPLRCHGSCPTSLIFLITLRHASRYFELYSPDGCIEIAHTSRYTHKTGKSELCILATRKLLPGSLITELKGSMAKLTREDERAMKNNGTIRMDFSVIHSGQMKKNHLFLGPARFVNVSSFKLFICCTI